MRDKRGSPAIEFAIVATPLVALIVAILEVSLLFFTQQVLDTTSEKAVRQLMTGQAQRNAMTKAQFTTSVCGTLPAYMKCSNVMVDVRSVSGFSDASTSPTLTYDSSGKVTNNWAYAPGASGSINVVTIMYLWDVQSGPLGLNLVNTAGGQHMLVSTSVFKTESYS